MLRELTRSINQLRKEKGLKIDEKNVILKYETEDMNLKNVIEKSEADLKKNCLLKTIESTTGLTTFKELEINGQKIKLNLK